MGGMGPFHVVAMTSTLAASSAARLPQMQEQVPLAPMTTLGVGGPARYYAVAQTSSEIIALLDWAQSRKLPAFILGGGSNVVFHDNGFPGLVLKPMIRGVRFDRDGDYELVESGAGHDWDDFVGMCVKHDLSGVECLSGIPGQVGGTPIQNVGAYGQEVSETIVKVKCIDRRNGRPRSMLGVQCGFGYRTSRFKTLDAQRYVITSVVYRLRRGGKPALRYADLERALAEEGITQPTLAQARDKVLQVRARKGMVLDRRDPDTRSCGSFFMNPVIPAADFRAALESAINEGFVKADDRVSVHDAGNDQVKVSAAWLIERAGLKRGHDAGGVGLSTKHVLAIVNRGVGTTAEVIELMRTIQVRVHDAFGIELRPEPVFAGFPEDEPTVR